MLPWFQTVSKSLECETLKSLNVQFLVIDLNHFKADLSDSKSDQVVYKMNENRFGLYKKFGLISLFYIEH